MTASTALGRSTSVLLVSAVFLAPALSFAATVPCPYTWSKSLKMGATGQDVRALQQALSMSPSGYYGRLTAKAVATFQVVHGLQQTGAVGPATRAQLNMLCVAPAATSSSKVLGAATTSIPIVADGLTITVPTQPEHTIAPPSALYVPFTRMTLTAGSKDVDVRTVTVVRAGAGSDSSFDYISILDESGTELGYGYLNADHKVTIHINTTIPAGTSQTITVAGNMKADVTDSDGQLPVLGFAAIDASAPISGSLPLFGTPQTVNESLTIGSAEMVLGFMDPHGAMHKTIGDTNVRFSSVRISATAVEDLKLDGITWTQTGTVSPSDLANVVVYVNDVSYPTTVSDRQYTATFPNSITIPRGQSVEVTVAGDVLVSGISRTVKFDIQYSPDISLRGAYYGYGIAPYPIGNTDVAGAEAAFLTSDGTTDGSALTPYFSGSTVSIDGASMIIGR